MIDADLRGLEQKVDALAEAFIYERSIDKAMYDRQVAALNNERARLEQRRQECSLDHDVDLEAVLTFAESVLADPAGLWLDASPSQRATLQTVFFPEGLHFDGKQFRTNVTCLMLNDLGDAWSVPCPS